MQCYWNSHFSHLVGWEMGLDALSIDSHFITFYLMGDGILCNVLGTLTLLT